MSQQNVRSRLLRPRVALSQCLVVLLLAAVSSGAWAQAYTTDERWTVRVDVASIDPVSRPESRVGAQAPVENRIESGFGAGIRIERRLGNWLGIELGLLDSGNFDGVAGGSATNGAIVRTGGFTAASLGVNFHLTADRPFDVYVGLQAIHLRHGDAIVDSAASAGGVAVPLDSELAWALIVGGDLSLPASGWRLQSSLRFIRAGLDGQRNSVVIGHRLDSVVLAVGLAYRF